MDFAGLIGKASGAEATAQSAAASINANSTQADLIKVGDVLNKANFFTNFVMNLLRLDGDAKLGVVRKMSPGG